MALAAMAMLQNPVVPVEQALTPEVQAEAAADEIAPALRLLRGFRGLDGLGKLLRQGLLVRRRGLALLHGGFQYGLFRLLSQTARLRGQKRLPPFLRT